MKFDEAISIVIGHEGTAFTQTAGDLGGATKFGITVPTLNEYNGQNNDAEDIRALTLKQAQDVYLKMFWTPMCLQQINDNKLASILLDQAVLIGKKRLVQRLQNLVGTKADGIMGVQTCAACNSRNTQNLIVQLLGLQTMYFVDLVLANSSQLKFLKGWEARNVSLLNYAFSIT